MRQLAKPLQIFAFAMTAMVSLSAWATASGHCGADGNQYDFKAGDADFTVGRDVLNNGQGWYLDAGAGEIIMPNKDGDLCEQKGTRPKAGNLSDRENAPDAPKCGAAINRTTHVEFQTADGHTDNKDYRWEWHKDDGSDHGGYLTITPLTKDGRPTNPYIIIRGGADDPAKMGRGEHLKNNLTVKVSSIPSETDNTAGGQSHSHEMDFQDADNGSGGTKPQVCTLGNIALDDKSNSWDKKQGLQDPEGKSTVQANTAPVHQSSGGQVSR